MVATPVESAFVSPLQAPRRIQSWDPVKCALRNVTSPRLAESDITC
jgi:hypothetical protein